MNTTKQSVTSKVTKQVSKQSAGQLQKLPTKAGHDVAITVFHCQDEAVKGVCIIAAATGVAQRLYRDFAIWLTTQGYHAVTFDYDGIGLSIDGHVKHCKSDVLSWASNDCPAVLEAVEQQFSGLECIWIGHSVGGHMLGMMPDTKQISRAINVAVGTGTWWYNSPSTKRVSWFLWYVLVPATVPLLGYFPGDKLKVMCNLPKGVMMQWRRWCLKDGYAVEGEGQWLQDRFASVNFPITAIAFSDDDMMSLKNIDMLHEQFSGADVTRHVIEPQDVGLKRIGHIGWHKAHCQNLWEQVISPVLSN